LLARIRGLLQPFRKNAIINEWKWFTADMLIALTYGVITFGFIYQHWEPGKTFYVGGLVILLGFVNQFTSVFHDVAWQYNQIIQYNTDVQTASNIEKAFGENHRPDREESLPRGWQRIDISHLNYSHGLPQGGQRRADSLHEIHLSLQRGKRVALIGESGSGKTTVMALLRGLYQPQATVQLKVDGYLHPFATLNETVTLLPQEPEIFENTIAYNITLGLPFPEAAIREVCRDAHFSEVVEQLPRGLDSNIQEKGVNLSGGQKQRLALARGILAARESEVVLLDEPTSSVDPKTEAAIYHNLFSAFRDKAVLSSLHRLHLLPLFDHIYVLQQGRVVEEGSFEQLLYNGLVFRELWQHQEDIHKRPAL
ncbi:MAG TPA: ABC transporter ATP-binding protein, partial [Puia sp.]|nr:ABC transporter ATP-binding protein [Puia sp.]